MEGFEDRYADIGGCRLHYVDEGEGRPLLFIHGLGGSMTNWTPNLEHFRRTNRVIAVDLPCYGGSAVVDSPCDLDFFADAIRGLLSMLGLDRVTVIGNSLGGFITLHLTLEHPEIVEAVVLVDTAGTHSFPAPLRWALHRLPESIVKKAIEYFSSRLLRYRIFYRMAGIYNINPYTRILIDEQVAASSLPDLDDYMEAYLRTSRSVVSLDYADRVSEIAQPCLIVWGQKDMGLPLKIGQRLNTKISGSFLVAVPRAAHVPQLDQPEIFNAAVQRFLEGTEVSRPWLRVEASSVG